MRYPGFPRLRYQRFIQGLSKIAAPLTSMLKTTVSSQVLVANEVLAADEVNGVEGGGESIEKFVESKTGKSSKSKKSPALKHAFILLRLAFTDIRIEENDLGMLDAKLTR